MGNAAQLGLEAPGGKRDWGPWQPGPVLSARVACARLSAKTRRGEEWLIFHRGDGWGQGDDCGGGAGCSLGVRSCNWLGG